jgi:hypothetical protein
MIPFRSKLVHLLVSEFLEVKLGLKMHVYKNTLELDPKPDLKAFFVFDFGSTAPIVGGCL